LAEALSERSSNARRACTGTIVACAQRADPCSGNERHAVPDHSGRRTLLTWLDALYLRAS
jgi:hypothetical protein